MKERFILEKESFRLSLDFEVFEKDVCLPLPTNTILYISVSSAGFAASTSMDIDIKDINAFCEKLQEIYDSLKGEAKLQDPFGNKQYISFSANKTGHIFVSGVLNSNGANGLFQELKFENSLDQTFLKTFIFRLKEFSSKF